MNRQLLTPSSEFSVITKSQASLVYEEMKRGDSFEVEDSEGNAFQCEKDNGIKFTSIDEQPPEVLSTGHVLIFMYENELDSVTSHFSVGGLGIREFFKDELESQWRQKTIASVPHLVERTYLTYENSLISRSQLCQTANG